MHFYCFIIICALLLCETNELRISVCCNAENEEGEMQKERVHNMITVG